MNRYIPDGAQVDAALALIEVLEIKGNNPHILELRRKCHEELAKILEGATVSFLTSVILEGRRQARRESNAIIS